MSLSIDHKDANMPSPGASIAGVLCCESLHTTLLAGTLRLGDSSGDTSD